MARSTQLPRKARVMAAALLAAAALAMLTPAPARATSSLRQGSSGPRVERLQRALRSTSYPTGKIDGQFGYKTLQAVYAFEKVHGLERDGVVPESELFMIERSRRPAAPQHRADDFIHVDISRQVLFEVRDGRVIHTIPVSTGNEAYYTQSGATYKAHTPRGSFSIERKIAGWRHAELGDIYYPSYFHEGYAFHGSESVPVYPASHGCVRLPIYVTEGFFDRNPIGRAVYITK